MRDVDIALVLAAGVLSPAPSGGGSSITVDDALSDSSENPVQNKVIAKEVGDLKSTVDTIVRSGAVNDTASGSIASFTDGADNVPVKDLTVAVEPVQDLHGYDNPWPAGGGKNLFNGTFLQGYWAYANGAWTSDAKWIATEKIPCKPSTYYTASADNRQTRWQGFVYYDNNGDYISTQNLNDKVPIGYTAQTPANAAYLIFNIAGGSEALDPISPSDVTHFQLEEGSSPTTYSPYSNICPISGWTGANVYHSGADTSDATTYSITFPAAAGTVYGGTLDVTTGKLTVDRAIVDLGTKKWYLSPSAGRTRFRASITDIARISSPNIVAPMLCSEYKTETANNTYSGRQGISLQQNAADVYVYDAQKESMSAADFKAAMSGVQLVYELATPIVYDLTPTEVKTLLAQNNIWADCGDSTVNYRADTKLYIDKKITAPASPESGQYLSWNGSAWVAASLPVYNGGVA